MGIRRFEVDISCISCANIIMKKLNQYQDIKYSINALEKIISIEADENKYSDDLIIKIIKETGYQAERM